MIRYRDLLSRLKPDLNPHRWLPTLLLLLALSSTALGLSTVVRQLEPWLLLSMAWVAPWVSWGLGRARLGGGWAAPVGVGLGGGLILFRVGRLGEPLLALAVAASRLGREGLAAWWSGEPGGWLPALRFLSPAWLEMEGRVETLLDRLVGWLAALARGVPPFDPVAAALVWSAAVWLVSLWAGWWLLHRKAPLVSLLPAGTLLAASLFFVTAQPWALLVFLGSALLLLAARRPGRSLSGEQLLAATILTLLLVSAAALVPSITVERVVDLVARFTDRPLSDDRSLAASLGLRRRGGAQTAIDRARVPGLPQQQLLGSGPELSERVVMLVTVEDTTRGPDSTQDAPPRYYWRSLSYERYTGRGWWTGTPRRVEQPPGAIIPAPQYAGQRLLLQSMQVLTGTGRLVYAAGALRRVEVAHTVAWRARSDLRGLDDPAAARDLFGVTTTAREFQVESWVSQPSQAELRGAGEAYPAWIRQRYLALPDDVSPQVIALARDLTATAPTPYDRALALETYLRHFPYTLNLPAPPPDQDLVEFFLFQLQRGYCDYFASAMVVLARAAGLPARLAVGFISNTYDAANGQYVVTAADAHSWVEVYFPDLGWVTFDPTPRLSPIERPAARSEAEILAEAERLRIAAETPDRESGWGWYTALGVGLTVIFGVGWLLVDAWRLRYLPPATALAIIYRRLHRVGRRLSVPTQPGDTPYQFGQAFGQRLIRLVPDPHRRDALRRDLIWLLEQVVRARFSPHLPTAVTRRRAVRTWQRLRRRFWRLWR